MQTHINDETVQTELPAGPRHVAPRSHDTPPHKPRLWGWLVGILLIAGAGYVTYRVWGSHTSEVPATSLSQTRRGGITPIVAKRSIRGDLPVYLDGPGTAQALNMVTIHSRVDGELIKVQFEEGQFVHKDDLIAEIDPRAYEVQLSQAQAQQAKDQAALENAKRDYQRYETAKEAIPQQLLDTAASQVTQSEAAVKIDQSAIDNARLLLSYTKITAPISGRMGLRMIDAGNIVHASDPSGLAVIAQVQPISVVFTLAQNALPQVQKAMKAQANLSVLAYDTTLTTLLARGSLSALDNQIDVSSATFKIKSIFDNKDLELFPNQFVNIRLLVEMRKQVVLVPAEAVQRSPQSTFVDVIKDDNTVEQRDVTPGHTEGGMTIIENGLDEGEMVATAGLDRLIPGAIVKIQSAETRPGRGNAAQTRSGNTQPSSQRGRGRGRGKEEENIRGPASFKANTTDTAGNERSAP